MFVIIIALCHLLVTAPLSLYYWIINLWLEWTWKLNETSLTGQKIALFIPGRDGHYGPLIPLINGIIQLGTDWTPRIANVGNMRGTRLHQDILNLQTILSKYPECEIALIGFSKGGVVALKYVTSFSDPRIRKIITISSPIQGTRIASIFPKSSIVYKDLAFQNNSSRELLSKKILVPLYHIVPVWDHLIIPGLAARHPKTPEENIYVYLGYKGHVGITHSSEVISAINNWLQEPNH